MVYHRGERVKTCPEVGVNDDEGPPVPMPNTEVKLIGAENTWRATAREDRSTPTLNKEISHFRDVSFLLYLYL